MYTYIYRKKNEYGVPCGRGNGGVLLALAEVLEHIPSKHKNDDKLTEIFLSFLTD